MTDAFIDDNWYRMDEESRDAHRKRERESMTPVKLQVRRMQAYIANHQLAVQGIRQQVAKDVVQQVAGLEVELGRRLVAWLINREIDRRTLARLPGETYGALLASGATDARGPWCHDEELRDIMERLFPESKTKPMTPVYHHEDADE